MKRLDRKQRAALTALEHALDHEPSIRPILVEDYYQAAAEKHELRRRLSELLPPFEQRFDNTGFSDGVL